MGPMRQRILKSLLAVAALAASASIIASPATAEIVVKKPAFGLKKPGVVIGPGGIDVHKPGVVVKKPRLGLKKEPVFASRSLKIDAVRTCTFQLKADAADYGYKSVELIDTDIEQLGRTKFVIHSKAKLFDGFDYQVDGYECLVDHGEVITTSELAPAKDYGAVFGGGVFKFR